MKRAEIKPAATTRRKTGVKTATVTVKFITPMFGGGVTVREAGKGSQFKAHDPVTPVRGASIRGQLRFWWRAARGAWLQSLKEMKEREAEIFGAASAPGALALAVKGHGRLDVGGQLKKLEIFDPNQNSPTPRERWMTGLAYGAFSLMTSSEDINAGHTARGYLHDVVGEKFDITLTFDESIEVELEAALSAWLTFGGLGGRTTRGFGAVTLGEVKGLSLSSDPSRVLQAASARAPLAAEVPSLSGASDLHCVGARTNSDTTRALSDTLVALRDMRQGVGVGRNRGQQHNRPGRSNWPEPDALRRITGRYAPNHRVPRHEGLTANFFPRAHFGMPIVFQFIGRRDGDPNPEFLQPVGEERMRSPLILRPTAEGRSMALVLSAPRADRVDAELKNAKRQVNPNLDENARRAIAQKHPALTHTDPLKSFIEFARSEWN